MAEGRTLRALADARARPVHVGAAVWPDHIYNEPDTYGTILPREFNSITLEAHHKWDHLLVDQRTAAVYNWEIADRTVEYAEQHRMAVKGHTLCWPEHLPEFAKALPKAKLREALLDHINQTMRHYLGRVASWDVVNESFASNGSGRPTNSALATHFGDEYVKDAFVAAHQADPNCKLLYNDCTIMAAGFPKSEAVYRMVEGLVKSGTPINGIGFQGHIDAAGGGEWGPPKPAALRTNIRRYKKLGLSCNISEMDVRCSGVIGNEAVRDKAAAAVYSTVLSTCLAEPNFDGVTFWGFTDKHSWINGFFGPDRPLLYDDNYCPKAQYDAVANALSGGEGQAASASGSSSVKGRLTQLGKKLLPKK
eukprot:TRINITY_DN13218_c0_g1_i1.p1 TRINITY_DN13218_c0_g1~~TRINITY_DN13218_c0_g1_i1.p1  ORF type:complete len:374 (-),score=98.79 TRINITY_DN13218_c0_g1_i1:410-1501(-)